MYTYNIQYIIYIYIYIYAINTTYTTIIYIYIYLFIHSYMYMFVDICKYVCHRCIHTLYIFHIIPSYGDDMLHYKPTTVSILSKRALKPELGHLGEVMAKSLKGSNWSQIFSTWYEVWTELLLLSFIDKMLLSRQNVNCVYEHDLRSTWYVYWYWI